MLMAKRLESFDKSCAACFDGLIRNIFGEFGDETAPAGRFSGSVECAEVVEQDEMISHRGRFIFQTDLFGFQGLKDSIRKLRAKIVSSNHRESAGRGGSRRQRWTRGSA